MAILKQRKHKMKTIPQENMVASPIDPAVLYAPELIRKRKEARRGVTDEQRRLLLTQAAERVSREYYEKFKRETLDLVRKQREARECKNKEAAPRGATTSEPQT